MGKVADKQGNEKKVILRLDSDTRFQLESAHEIDTCFQFQLSNAKCRKEGNDEEGEFDFDVRGPLGGVW